MIGVWAHKEKESQYTESFQDENERDTATSDVKTNIIDIRYLYQKKNAQILFFSRDFVYYFYSIVSLWLFFLTFRREFDVTYYQRVLIDKNIRVGNWYKVTVAAGKNVKNQNSTCQKSLKNFLPFIYLLFR